MEHAKKKSLKQHRELRRKEKAHTAAELEELKEVESRLIEELSLVQKELSQKHAEKRRAKRALEINALPTKTPYERDSKGTVTRKCDVAYSFSSLSKRKEFEISLTLQNQQPDEVIRCCVLEWTVNGEIRKTFTYSFCNKDLQSTVAHCIKWEELLDMLNKTTPLNTNENKTNGNHSVNIIPGYGTNKQNNSSNNANHELISDYNNKNKNNKDQPLTNCQRTRYNDIVINVFIAHGLPENSSYYTECFTIVLPHLIMYVVAFTPPDTQQEKIKSYQTNTISQQQRLSEVSLRFNTTLNLDNVAQKLQTLFAPISCYYFDNLSSSSSPSFSQALSENVKSVETEMRETFMKQLSNAEPLVLQLLNVIEGNNITLSFANERVNGSSSVCTIKGELMQHCGRLVDAIQNQIVNDRKITDAYNMTRDTPYEVAITTEARFPYEKSVIQELLSRVKQYEAICVKLTTEIADGAIAIKPLLMYGNEASSIFDLKMMESCYSDAFDVTRELIDKDAKRLANLDALHEALSQIRFYVQCASELFTGTAKEKFLCDCVNAMQRNQWQELLEKFTMM